MKIDIKEKAKEIKAFWNNLDVKKKKTYLICVAVIVAVAVVTAIVLNNKTYVPVFTQLSQDEAQEIANYLQTQGADFQYSGDGTILVEEKQADATLVELISAGYPSSGFTYSTFIDNAGGMATETEMQVYEKYGLQDRLGAIISTFFEGVRDAKVTISLGEEQKYVLQSDSDKAKSTASVVVMMKNGYKLSEETAQSLQRLIATSVPNLAMEDVAVFDENMIELSSSGTKEETGSTEVELANIVEQKIEQKVANVLSAFYGNGNIRVSANGKINMENVIRESVTYSTPEKIDENDKTGIISSESGSETSSNSTANGGVAGTEENSDTTDYNQNGENGQNTQTSTTYDREYLVDYVKEQTEVGAGLMDDLTVSISINAEDFGSLTANDVKNLVANATGIDVAQADTKITVVAAPFYDSNGVSETIANVPNIVEEYWWIFAIVGASLLAILIVILTIKSILKKRRLKREKANMGDEDFIANIVEDNKDDSIDILNMKNERSRELRENIREFADDNPEISAQMLRTWLNGGDHDGGN